MSDASRYLYQQKTVRPAGGEPVVMVAFTIPARLFEVDMPEAFLEGDEARHTLAFVCSVIAQMHPGEVAAAQRAVDN